VGAQIYHRKPVQMTTQAKSAEAVDTNDTSREELIRRVEALSAKVKRLEKRKYGIVWEDKKEEVAELCRTQLPVLVEEKAMRIKADGRQPPNILIEGDNYHSLSVLNYTHGGRIDMIYIDPPYNTGARDWKYNNDFVDINDVWRHSKWLSLMAKRLLLAKRLLKKDGVMVIAIDDNEVHRLRMLIERLMPGYDITTVVIVHNPRGNITNNFARTHEYALFVIPRRLSVIARTRRENASPRKLRRWGHNSTRKLRPTMFYPIYVKEGKIARIGEVPAERFHPTSRNMKTKDGEIEVWPIDQDGVERRWNFSRDRIEDELDRLIAVETKNVIDIFVTQEDTTPKTVWTETQMEAGRWGATLLRSLVKTDFPYPKSLYNVKKCLELVVGKRKEATILDFFAGSGTTGHAVLALNSEDGGNRKFILCTNDENGICRKVCYPRIKAVIRSYEKESKEKLEGARPGGLRYYTTSFVDRSPTDLNKKRLVDKSTEMLCLREYCFEPLAEGNDFKIFEDRRGKVLGIVYSDEGIEPFKRELRRMGTRATVYVFSLDQSAREEEFADMEDQVVLRPIPAVILNVYNKILAEAKPKN
jgi:adenine-specific DNA-methyltransferase